MQHAIFLTRLKDTAKEIGVNNIISGRDINTLSFTSLLNDETSLVSAPCINMFNTVVSS